MNPTSIGIRTTWDREGFTESQCRINKIISTNQHVRRNRFKNSRPSLTTSGGWIFKGALPSIDVKIIVIARRIRDLSVNSFNLRLMWCTGVESPALIIALLNIRLIGYLLNGDKWLVKVRGFYQRWNVSVRSFYRWPIRKQLTLKYYTSRRTIRVIYQSIDDAKRERN